MLLQQQMFVGGQNGMSFGRNQNGETYETVGWSFSDATYTATLDWKDEK